VKKHLSLKLSTFYFILGPLLLSIYGITVCRFIDGLSLNYLFSLFLGFYLFFAFIRFVLYQFLSITRYSLVDFTTYFAAGIGTGLVNNYFHQFPVDSTLKITLGSFIIGLFATIDLALIRQRSIDIQVKNMKGQFISITKKMGLFLSIVLSVSMSIIILAIIKDLNYFSAMGEIGSGNIQMVKKEVLLDISYITGVIVLLCYRLIYTFSKNLNYLFQKQITALHQVNQGNLSVQVPMIAHDEFGQMAFSTNKMIHGLREKEEIKQTFGKMVGSEVAEKILANKGKELHRGQKENVIILFSDIRSFTQMSENSGPEEIISFLNQYFELAVDIIQKHGGLVDKFIGDALLAIFGLEQGEDQQSTQAINAVKASQELYLRAQKLNRPDGLGKLDIGIGLHYGQVVAGTVGSPHRFEYTVIGDTVNTASRLEGLTKELKRPLLISDEVFQLLSPVEQALFQNMGEKKVKGREQKLQIFGQGGSV
jgi:class 3 adenylate cyclase